MIKRYETEEMKKIWSDEHKFACWLEVELAVCKAWASKGMIPRDALREIEKKASFSIERIAELESETRHDVIAFVSSVAETVGDNGRYIHMGLTSSDVIDTASALLLKESAGLIISELKKFCAVLLKRAAEYKFTPCVGRTHGIHAEPTSFGLKLLNFYSQFLRDTERLEFAREQISFGKISGAVGSYVFCPPDIEAEVCRSLGISPDPVSNQIVQRDRHSSLINAIAVLGCSLERLATEIRGLQRTEINEVFEPFASGQKGSSAMPHKRNPIICERICGMARLLRGYAAACMENIALWHERDISHSSVERVVWADSFHLMHRMLLDMNGVISGLQVDEDKMRDNISLTKGLVFSQRVLLHLMEKAGVSREEAYRIVQDNASKCWEESQLTFFDSLSSDARVTKYINARELEELFDVSYYLKYAEEIFNRFVD
ncbi:MAG: adenylosuccinate lyase [Synergistaceae bacterium]|nr:adenylosuccinate lyase [Synergistaceae bacterium]